MTNLLDKANAWLSPHGYTIFQKSADNTWANYIHMDRNAAVEVFIKNDEMVCKGHSFLGHTLVTIQSPVFPLGNNNLFRQLDIIDVACQAYDDCQD